MSMKRTLCAIVVLMMIVAAFAGCGSKAADNQAVDLESLKTAMLEADQDLPVMSEISSDDEDGEDLFAYLSSLPYSDVEEYFFAYSDSGMAEEIAVIVLKDSSKADEAVESLKEHVQDRVTLFTTYAPDQVEDAENALTFSKDNLAVMIMGKNAGITKAAFEKYMEGDMTAE